MKRNQNPFMRTLVRVVDPLWFRFRQSPFGSLFVRARRGVYTGRLPQNGINLNLNFLRGSRSRFMFFFVILCLISLISALGISLWSLDLRRSSYDSENYSPQYSDHMQILLLVTDSQESYDYISGAAVLSVSLRGDDVHKLVAINPDYSAAIDDGRKVIQVKVRNLLAQADLKDREQLTTLWVSVEAILGLRLDRYLIVSQDQVPELLNSVGQGIVVNDENFSGKAKGDMLASSEYVRYLFPDFYDKDAYLWRQVVVLTDVLRKFHSITGVISLISQQHQWAKSFTTNLTAAEWRDVAVAMIRNQRIETNVLRIADAYKVESPQGNYFQPLSINVDRQIKDTFSQIEVVKEQARVEVYNGTSLAGMARKYQRIIENQGGNVIKTANNPELLNRSILYIRNKENFPRTISMVVEQLRNQVVVTEEPYPYNTASDLVLVLGADLN